MPVHIMFRYLSIVFLLTFLAVTGSCANAKSTETKEIQAVKPIVTEDSDDTKLPDSKIPPRDLFDRKTPPYEYSLMGIKIGSSLTDEGLLSDGVEGDIVHSVNEERDLDYLVFTPHNKDFQSRNSCCIVSDEVVYISQHAVNKDLNYFENKMNIIGEQFNNRFQLIKEISDTNQEIPEYLKFSYFLKTMAWGQMVHNDSGASYIWWNEESKTVLFASYNEIPEIETDENLSVRFILLNTEKYDPQHDYFMILVKELNPEEPSRVEPAPSD